jgi:1-deoxy-D-xylulose-5-phosphate reductoisomerase
LPAVLNAANEIAVGAFLEGRLSFAEIAPLIDRTLQAHRNGTVATLDDVMAADQWARTRALAALVDDRRVAS